MTHDTSFVGDETFIKISALNSSEQMNTYVVDPSDDLLITVILIIMNKFIIILMIWILDLI